MLDGDMKAFPHLFIPIVDVRDVAAAHILAMTSPDAAGQRFLLSNGPALAIEEIGATIRTPSARRRGGSPPDPSLSPGRTPATPGRTSNVRARQVLGWTPRDPHVAIVSAAESMLHHGLLKH